MSQSTPMKNPKNFFEFVFWILNVLIIHFWKITSLVTVVTTIAIIYVLLAEQKFKSEAIVYVPSENQSGLSGALGKMAGLALPNIDLNGSSADMDLVLTILDTRDILDGVIKKFDLVKEGDIDTTDQTWYPSTLKFLRKQLIKEVTDENAIIIGFTDTSYVRAYEITNYLVASLDSIYTAVNQERRVKQRDFYEKRVLLAKKELAAINDSLIAFSRSKNILDLDIQVKESIKQLADLEAQSRWLEIELNTLKKDRNASLSEISSRKNRLGQIQKELRALKRGKSGTLILPSENLGQDMSAYYDLYREYKIRETLYQFLRQALEEKLLAIEKNLGNIIVIQKPWINKKRISPPRSAIVVSVFMLALLLCVIWAVSIENYRVNRDGKLAQLLREAIKNFKVHVLFRNQ